MTPPLTSEQVEQFRRALEASWVTATEVGPAFTTDLRIAGIDLRVMIVGERLAAALLPAFAHHDPAATSPTVLLGAWDAESVGAELPEPPGADDPNLESWVVWRDDVVVAQLERQDDGLVRSTDLRDGRYLLGVERAEDLSWWEAASPFRRQLHWALAPDALPIHAAAVGRTDGAALIVGRGGSGKTSTALACVRAGLGYLAEDTCALRMGSTPSVHSLYCNAKVTHEEMAFVGDLADTRDPDVPDGDKAVIFPLRRYPEQRLVSAPVRMVVIPEIAGGSTPQWEPATPGDALRALAPSSVLQQHLAPARELATLRRLVSVVPARRLLLSPDRSANAEAIREALDAS